MTRINADGRYQMDITSGSIFTKMLRFALPLMAASLLQLAFNAADIIVVGRFCGDNSMAAVGSNGSMVNLLTNFFVGLSVGTNVLAARFFGAKSNDELSKTVHTSMLISIISGIVLTIVGLFSAKQLLIWMKTPDAVMDLAVAYLKIYFLGMTATTIYNFGSAILRAIGDTRRPLYFLVISGAVNVLLNLLFVLLFKLDVTGVAIATVISQIISAVLIVRCLIHEIGGVRLELSKLRINRAKLLQIVKIGLPAGLQGTLFSLSNVVIQSSINLFGETVMSGNAAAVNLEGFVYVAMNAFYQTVISFSSQCFGKHLYKRIVKVVLIGLICVTVTGILLGLGLTLIGSRLLWIYTDNAAVVEAGIIRFQYVASLYFLCGVMDCLVGGLRGIGYSFIPMIVSLIGSCGLRLLWITTVFNIPEYHVIETVYASYPISWFITGLTHAICFIFMLRHVRRKIPSEL